MLPAARQVSWAFLNTHSTLPVPAALRGRDRRASHVFCPLLTALLHYIQRCCLYVFKILTRSPAKISQIISGVGCFFANNGVPRDRLTNADAMWKRLSQINAWQCDLVSIATRNLHLGTKNTCTKKDLNTMRRIDHSEDVFA